MFAPHLLECLGVEQGTAIAQDGGEAVYGPEYSSRLAKKCEPPSHWVAGPIQGEPNGPPADTPPDKDGLSCSEEGGAVMKASDIMRRPVVAATPTATARDVAIQRLMGEFSGVPVAQSDGSVVGVVTELDLIRAVVRAGKALEITLARTS
jgi:hypothetical protein